jgi:hypothetical protein
MDGKGELKQLRLLVSSLINSLEKFVTKSFSAINREFNWVTN